MTTLRPASWPRPKGYANDVGGGGFVVIAGQIGWDMDGESGHE